jgi:hypothetical protein
MSLIFQKIGASGIATKIWSGFTGGVRKMLGSVALSLMGIGDRLKQSTVLTTIWGTITKGVGMAFKGIMTAGTWMLNTMFPGLIAKMTALKGVGSIFGGATATADVASGAAKGGKAAADVATGGVAKAGKTAKGMKNAGKVASVAKGATVAGNVAQGSSLIPMAAGLTAMGTAAVAAGAANLIIAGIGFTAMIPGTIGMFLMSKINLVALGAGLTTLATGLSAMSGTFLGSAALAVSALAFTLMIPGALGMAAFGLAAPMAAAGLGIMGVALTAFGRAILEGKANWRDENSIDYYVGGLHIC